MRHFLRSRGSAHPVNPRQPSRSGRVSVPSSRFTDFISPLRPIPGRVGGLPVRGRRGRGGAVPSREGVVPGIGSFRRGTGREPGILTRQSRGGGSVGVSRDLPVGAFRGVPRDRVPRPPRSGRRPVGGRGRAGSPCFSAGRACACFCLCVSVMCGPMCVCVWVLVSTVHNKLFLID